MAHFVGGGDTAAGGAAKYASDGRTVVLQGQNNFRDIGGYAAAGGRTVRRGRLFRSGSMAGLEPADQAKLAGEIKLKTQVCFEGVSKSNEGESPPSERPSWRVVEVDLDARVVSADGKLPDTLCSAVTFVAAAKEAVVTQSLTPLAAVSLEALSTTVLVHARSAVADALRMVMDPHAHPCVFNCTAGKDRTGVIALLVLELLGVSREDRLADYMLTGDRFADNVGAHKKVIMMKAGLKEISPDAVEAALAPLTGVSPAVVDAVDAVLAEYWGGIEGYCSDIGLSAAEIAAFRAVMLE